MAWYDQLTQQGMGPKSVPPNTVFTEDGNFGRMDQSRLGRVLRGLNQLQFENQQKAEQRQKAMKAKVDMYKTLRDAGYDAKSAHDAILHNKFPGLPGNDDPQDEQKQATLEKTKAETTKIKTDTEQVGKERTGLQDKILQKVSDGEPLSPGEQKVYDDVIKKKGSGLDEIFGSPEQDPMVAVTDPAGKKGFVPKSKLDAAIKKGYKKR